MAFNFMSKKILVTGAGRGLGREVAIRLNECGADVYAVSRTAATLETLKDEHPSIQTITLDLSKWDESRRVLKQLDVMDGLVNNAGLMPTHSYEAISTDYATMQAYMDNSLFSAINCTQIFAEKMISAKKPGCIVNISSNGSYKASRGIFPYCLAKAAMEMVTRQFALELGANGIRVNSVNPTLFMTDTIKALCEQYPLVERTLDRTPMKQLPETRDVAGTVMFLLSEHSAMVTGISLYVDGGNDASISS